VGYIAFLGMALQNIGSFWGQKSFAISWYVLAVMIRASCFRRGVFGTLPVGVDTPFCMILESFS
jgi:hypothetical protein